MTTLGHIIILLTQEQVIKAKLLLFMIEQFMLIMQKRRICLMRNMHFTNENSILAEEGQSGIRRMCLRICHFTPASVIKIINKLNINDNPGSVNPLDAVSQYTGTAHPGSKI